MNARFLAIASTMGAELSEAEICKTTEIVRRLSDETKGRSEQLPRSKKLAAFRSVHRASSVKPS